MLQSKLRGITLDLGFSSFTVPLPPHFANLPFSALQFTLVGLSSLLWTADLVMLHAGGLPWSCLADPHHYRRRSDRGLDDPSH
jgi:hypothetical protein